MSATYDVDGLRNRDSVEHQRKTAVLRACQEAGVRLPNELEDYFKVDGRRLECVSPDDAVTIDLLRDAKVAKQLEGETGFEVDLKKLPPGVETIRFRVSW